MNVLGISMPLLHIGLAWGCKVKSEISRKISLIAGFLMLLGIPIGTFLGLFVIRFADWESLPSEKTYSALAGEMRSSLKKAKIEYRSLQKFGLVFMLISPITFAIILADVGLGFHVLSSNMVLGGHWLAIAGMQM